MANTLVKSKAKKAEPQSTEKFRTSINIRKDLHDYVRDVMQVRERRGSTSEMMQIIIEDAVLADMAKHGK